MTVWFTSDTHFSHARIIELSNRPFKDVDHMNHEIIRRWNELVSPDDTVYHLGDVALGPKETWKPILESLNGNKILVTGNHDVTFAKNKEAYREKHKHLYDSFDEIHDNLRGVWLEDGTIVDLSHFPYDGDSHDGDRFTDVRLPDSGRVLIHGHTHLDSVVSRSKRGTIQIHVGMDAHNYTPVSEEQVIRYIEIAKEAK